MISKAVIVHALTTNPAAVERAILLLHAAQTADEQSMRSTRHANGKGFSAQHAHLGTYYAKWILSGKRLSGKHLDRAREMAMHYAGTQLLAAAHEKSVRRANESMARQLVRHDPFQRTVGVGFLL